MKKSIKTILLASLISSVSFAQSPWTKDKGKAYVQVGVTGLFYNSYADENGNLIAKPPGGK